MPRTFNGVSWVPDAVPVTVDPEQVSTAIDAYLAENPPSGSTGYPVQRVTLTGSITLSTSGWPTSQVVVVYFIQDVTGGWLVTLPSNVVTAYNVGWGPSTLPGSETVAQFRYSAGLAKWVCEACWVSVTSGSDSTAPDPGELE